MAASVAVDGVLRRQPAVAVQLRHCLIICSSVIVERIEAARARGIPVYADQYPYSASGTGITGALIPRWAQVAGRDALLRRTRAPTAPSRASSGFTCASAARSISRSPSGR